LARIDLATKEVNMNIFFVGMQVICVDDCGLPKTSNLPNKPVRGRVYKIRYVGINPIGEIGVTLHELVNPKSRTKWGHISEPGFFAWRFRPATDISTFKRITEKVEQERRKEQSVPLLTNVDF
jgi:hypothetical protein